MAKNMTRKGLAIGASAALAAAGVVGISSPAMADSNIYLVPNVGGASQNRVPIEEDFTLKTYYGVNANGLLAPVSVQITDADENLASVTLSDGTATYSSTDDVWTASMTGTQAGIGNAETIQLTPNAVTADSETFSVIVTTWFDDGDGTPEAGETQASQEIFFHVEDDYDWVIDFTAPELADTSFEATVSTTVPSINLAMIADNFGVAFGTVASNGDLTAATADSDVSGDSIRFDGGTSAADTSTAYVVADADADFVDFQTDGTVDFEVEASATVIAATFRAAVVFDGTSAGSTTTLSLNGATQVAAATAVVGAATISDIEQPSLVVGADVDGTNIRKEATSVAFESTVYESYSSASVNEVAEAGTEITVTVTKGTWDADSSLVIGGETLTDTTTDGEVSFTTTVDADGKISFTANPSGVEADDTFTVALSAQGVSVGTDGNASSDTFTVLETAAAELIEHNLLGDSAAWKVEDGSYTIRFAALDNFGQPLASEGFRVRLNNGLSADDVATGLVGGVATFSVSTEKSDETDVSTFTAYLEAASGASWVDAVSGSNADQATLSVTLGSSNAADTVTVTGYTLANEYTQGTYDLAGEALASANGRLGEALADAPTLGTTLAGQLTDASGINTYGSVTLSGEGVLFSVDGDGKDVFSLGSVTVQTNATGAFAGVKVYSNTAGDNAITVTSGSASQAIIVTFAAADDATGAELSIDAPTSVEPGSTLKLSASLVDVYGNPVETDGGDSSTVVVNYDGPGFVVGDTPDAFDADGELELTIFLGQNDDGKTGTFTVSYSPTASATEFDGDDDIVKQATVIIGDAPSGEFNAWTKLSDDLTNVKFYAKNPSTQGKIQFFMNGVEIAWHRGTSPTSYEGGALVYNAEMDANYLVRDRDLVVGSQNVFEIYQDGTRIWRAVKTID